MVVTDDSESYIKTNNDSIMRPDDEDAELYDNSHLCIFLTVT